MTDTTMHADFEKWAEDYCLSDPHQKQDCFFAYQAATERATQVERERAAKVCDVECDGHGGIAAGPMVTDFGKHTHQSMAAGAKNCAAAIRQGGTP